MAASATGSVPLSISSSVSEEDKALLTLAPNIDACSETRRSDSFGLLVTAFWAGSEGAQSYLIQLLHEYNGSSNNKLLTIYNVHYRAGKNDCNFSWGPLIALAFFITVALSY